MSYRAASKPATTTPKAAATNAPAASTFGTDDPRLRKPVGNLKIRAAGEKEASDIGAVFANTTKNGDLFLKVKDADGNVFQLFLNHSAPIQLIMKD
jgi:hypothetical protein